MSYAKNKNKQSSKQKGKSHKKNTQNKNQTKKQQILVNEHKIVTRLDSTNHNITLMRFD